MSTEVIVDEWVMLPNWHRSCLFCPLVHCYKHDLKTAVIPFPPFSIDKYAFPTPFDRGVSTVGITTWCTVVLHSSQLRAKTFHLSFHSSSMDAASPISQRNLRRRWEDPPLVILYPVLTDGSLLAPAGAIYVINTELACPLFTFSLCLQCHNSQSG